MNQISEGTESAIRVIKELQRRNREIEKSHQDFMNSVDDGKNDGVGMLGGVLLTICIVCIVLAILSFGGVFK